MKNYYYRKNNIFINNGFLTRKNSHENDLNYKYIRQKFGLNGLNKDNYSLSQINVSHLILTNRPINNHKKLIFNPLSKNTDSNNTHNKKNHNHSVKLNPILKKKLFENNELNRYTVELIDNKSIFNNTKIFKKTVNQSSQSDFDLDEEDQDSRIKKEHFLKIDDLLNKKLDIHKIRSRRAKLNFKFSEEKDSLINNLMKQNNNNIFNMKYKKLKPLKFYFKFATNKNENTNNINNNKSNIIPKNLNFKKRNYSLILPKANSFEEKSDYDIVTNSENNKVFYANKLVYDNVNNKNIKNENNFYLKKIGDNINNFQNQFLNKNKILGHKFKYNSMNIKNRNAKNTNFISYEKIKKLSKKGYDKLMYRKLENLTQQIYDVVGIIESNKKKFRGIMETNAEVYLKNKKIEYDDDLF